jgi:hypothetical protein
MTILSAADYAEITCVCRLIRITAECDTCGAVVTAVHAPDVTWGFYCRRCCPCLSYHPDVAELAAMEYNRARIAESKLSGAVKLKMSEAAKRRWADPQEHQRIMIAMRSRKQAR